MTNCCTCTAHFQNTDAIAADKTTANVADKGVNCFELISKVLMYFGMIDMASVAEERYTATYDSGTVLPLPSGMQYAKAAKQ